MKTSLIGSVFVPYHISVVHKKTSWDDLFMFWGVLNETMIPLALIECEIISANSNLRASSLIQHAPVENLSKLFFMLKLARQWVTILGHPGIPFIIGALTLI